MKSLITALHPREILDSRGNPTVEVTAILADGSEGVASVPSGASTGVHEALELRDGDAKRYGGKGVLKAVNAVKNQLFAAVKGMDALQQKRIDAALCETDGTENKSRLGANAILGVSLAVAHAAARSTGVPLYRYLAATFGYRKKTFSMPIAMMNIVNGGRHADNGLDIQEYLLMPQRGSFAENLRIGAEVFHTLGTLLKGRYSTQVGDEGGYAPRLKTDHEAFELILEAVATAGYRAGRDVKLGIDLASSEFFDAHEQAYVLTSEKRKLSSQQLVSLLGEWVDTYHLASIEDGLHQDDWEGWATMTETLGKKCQLVGDDLFVTSVKRLTEGVKRNVANAILIKVNQIGTLSETMACIALAQKSKYAVAASHRSGETCDTTIADLAVAVGAQYLKAGSLSRGERLAKYNRLLAIEEELHAKSV